MQNDVGGGEEIWGKTKQDWINMGGKCEGKLRDDFNVLSLVENKNDTILYIPQYIGRCDSFLMKDEFSDKYVEFEISVKDKSENIKQIIRDISFKFKSQEIWPRNVDGKIVDKIKIFKKKQLKPRAEPWYMYVSIYGVSGWKGGTHTQKKPSGDTTSPRICVFQAKKMSISKRRGDQTW